jgi:signal transduction histidine kinase
VRPRLTLRARLALWYAVVFLVGASLLVAAALLVIRLNWGPVTLRVPVDGDSFMLPQRTATVHAWRRSVLELAPVVGLLALGSLAAGWLVAGRALRPLARIVSTAEQLSAENLGARIGLAGPDDELKRLADSLDGMLARVERVVESQRQFVANASHELRTPLAIMRAGIEVSLLDPRAGEQERADAIETIRRSVGRSDNLVSSLLTLADTQSGTIERTSVDLAELAGGVVHDYSDLAERRGVEVSTSLATARVAGSSPLLRALVANLVENAVLYNRLRGRVELATGSDAGGAWISVRNTGAVVLPDEVDGLFEPFARLDSSRTRSTGGAGLGLSIVRAVADAHGAQVDARAQELGGLEIAVRIPVAKAPPARAVAPAPQRFRRVLRSAAGFFLFTAVALALLAGAAAAAHLLVVSRADAAAARGSRAFPLAARGMSAANVERLAGRPSWQGRSGICVFRFGRGLGAEHCGRGDVCYAYGDVEASSSTVFCFHNGLRGKTRWDGERWRKVVTQR